MTRVVLASFDRVPASKGASQHILANVAALGPHYDVSLISLGDAPAPQVARHLTLAIHESNWLRRALRFREHLLDIFEQNPFDIYHVRSPWEGLTVPMRGQLIYEVNGLASIELPYHYSDLHTLPRLLDRLATMEDALIGRADRIITPSPVTREHLLDRGADPGRITLVPNSPSVVPTARSLQPRDARIRLCYIGTLTSWQGLYDAIKVMARLAHHPIHLTVATAARRSDRKALARFARKRGLSEQIAIVDPVPPSQLLTFLQQHDLGLAPLTPCARNLVQGCMPIKVLDYMAAGLPVLAPDMPAVQHIVGDNYPLYRRYSRGHMTDHLERLVTDPGLRETLSRQGLQRARHFGPQRQRDALLGVYRDLASTSSST